MQCPYGIYLLKVNDRNTKTGFEIFSMFTRKTSERCQMTLSWCLYCYRWKDFTLFLTSTNLYTKTSIGQLVHWRLYSLLVPLFHFCLPNFSLFSKTKQKEQCHYLCPFVYSLSIFLPSCSIPLIHFGIWCMWFISII